MITLDADGLNGSVLVDSIRDNGYSEEEYQPGNIIRFEEGNVIFHVYIDAIREDKKTGKEWADFMVYWPN